VSRGPSALGAFFVGAGVMHFVRPREYRAHAERFRAIPEPLLWLRLPFQAVFLAWVWRVAAQ